MTRHELKEQLQHDQFTDVVSGAVGYAQSHREQVIRWAIIALAVLVIGGALFWYSAYRRSVREKDLQAAFAVLETPIGPANPSGGKSFATDQDKKQASMKALSDVVAKDGGSREGLLAQYYRGTLRAQSGDARGAIADLDAVAGSSNPCAPLAKIALAELYAGQNRISDAQNLLRGMVDHPADLVSKEQAQIMLARLDETANPQEAKKILQSLKTPTEDPAVRRAADELSSQLTK